MLRWSLAIIAFVALSSGAAWAQSASYNIGAREIGQAHNLSLTARNDNCPQRLDFRFTFAPSPWLRPQGDTVVRGVPTGQSRPLPVIVDLTQMPAGHHTAEVDVSCENCSVMFIRTCDFNRQHLTISVDATEPARAPGTTALTPAPAARPATVRPATPPQTAPPAAPPPTTSAPAPSSAAPTPQPAPVTAPTTETPAPIACDCAAETGVLRAIAAIAALAALGFAAWAFNASRAAQALSNAAQNTQPPDTRLRAFLQERAQELEEFNVNCRQSLLALLNTQLQAVRALAALGLIDRATPEAEAWTRVCNAGGFAIAGNGASVVLGRDGGGLGHAIAAAHGQQAAAQALFAPFGPGGDRAARLAWLRQQGYAANEDAARAVLNEIANYFAHGGSLADITARLQDEVDECRRSDAELAAAVAKAAAGG